MKHNDFLKRLNEASKRKLEFQKKLIEEGKPYIIYFRGVHESNREVFLNEEDCKQRIAELEKRGYLVNRIQ